MVVFLIPILLIFAGTAYWYYDNDAKGFLLVVHAGWGYVNYLAINGCFVIDELLQTHNLAPFIMWSIMGVLIGVAYSLYQDLGELQRPLLRFVPFLAPLLLPVVLAVLRGNGL